MAEITIVMTAKDEASRVLDELRARLGAQIPILDRIIAESRDRAAYLRGLL